MTFFDAFPFLAGLEFPLFLIGCGFFARLGFLLAGWFVESVELFCQRWKNPHWLALLAVFRLGNDIVNDFF